MGLQFFWTIFNNNSPSAFCFVAIESSSTIANASHDLAHFAPKIVFECSICHEVEYLLFNNTKKCQSESTMKWVSDKWWEMWPMCSVCVNSMLCSVVSKFSDSINSAQTRDTNCTRVYHLIERCRQINYCLWLIAATMPKTVKNTQNGKETWHDACWIRI